MVYGLWMGFTVFWSKCSGKKHWRISAKGGFICWQLPI